MLWLTKHARLRNKLSPYIDGRLTAAEVTALEAHLVRCEACRRELEELRATASTMRQLPDAEAPRSFAITPGMLERRAVAAALPMPAMGAGMRLAGAAVAVALAVVLVGDLTLGDGNGSAQQGAGSQPAEESRIAAVTGDADTSKNGEYGFSNEPSRRAESSTPPANAGAAAPCPSSAVPAPATGGAGGAGGPASGGGSAGGVGSSGRGSGETSPSTATPEPALSPTFPPTSAQATAPAAAAMCGDASSGFVAPVAPVPSSVDAQRGAGGTGEATRAASTVNDGGGISTLRVAEIVLAAILIAMLAGIVLEAALRRRRVA